MFQLRGSRPPLATKVYRLQDLWHHFEGLHEIGASRYLLYFYVYLVSIIWLFLKLAKFSSFDVSILRYLVTVK